jgi:hypothetical protein
MPRDIAAPWRRPGIDPASKARGTFDDVVRLAKWFSVSSPVGKAGLRLSDGRGTASAISQIRIQHLYADLAAAPAGSWAGQSAEQELHKWRARRATNAMNAMSDDVKFTPADYSVVVKRRDAGEKPWRWEIWVAGKSRHIERSEQPFATMSEATREGKAALKTFLAKRFSDAA